jgi:hypothetical protein
MRPKNEEKKKYRVFRLCYDFLWTIYDEPECGLWELGKLVFALNCIYGAENIKWEEIK